MGGKEEIIRRPGLNACNRVDSAKGTQGPSDGIKYLQFIEKLICNFKLRFDDLHLGKQLLLFIQNPFLVTDIVCFSNEAKNNFKWIDEAKIQLELADFQENIMLKELLSECTSEAFWSKEEFFVDFTFLHKLAIHILTMFGSTYFVSLHLQL